MPDQELQALLARTLSKHGKQVAAAAKPAKLGAKPAPPAPSSTVAATSRSRPAGAATRRPADAARDVGSRPSLPSRGAPSRSEKNSFMSGKSDRIYTTAQPTAPPPRPAAANEEASRTHTHFPHMSQLILPIYHMILLLDCRTRRCDNSRITWKCSVAPSLRASPKRISRCAAALRWGSSRRRRRNGRTRTSSRSVRSKRCRMMLRQIWRGRRGCACAKCLLLHGSPRRLLVASLGIHTHCAVAFYT